MPTQITRSFASAQALVATWTLKKCKEYVGGLSNPSKMPGKATGLPASACFTGQILAKLEERLARCEVPQDENQPATICSKCYADNRGNYGYSTVQLAQQRRLDALYRPLWIACMVRLIAHYSSEVFRFHDSGDIQSVKHLRNIVLVCEALPGTRFWLPTREVQMLRDYRAQYGAFPSNLAVRVSAYFFDSKPPRFSGLEDLPTSTAHTKHDEFPRGKGSIECRAYARDGECGSCRACWSAQVNNVSYRAH